MSFQQIKKDYVGALPSRQKDIIVINVD